MSRTKIATNQNATKYILLVITILKRNVLIPTIYIAFIRRKDFRCHGDVRMTQIILIYNIVK